MLKIDNFIIIFAEYVTVNLLVYGCIYCLAPDEAEKMQICEFISKCINNWCPMEVLICCKKTFVCVLMCNNKIFYLKVFI